MNNCRSREINQLTRRSIEQALFQLMKKVSFSSITVTELCKRAGVSRNAYYRNFIDMNHVLSEYLSEQWDSYYAANCKKYVLPHELGEMLCSYIYSEREFITLLYRNDLMYILEEQLYQSLGPDDGAKTSELYIKSCIAYTVYGLVVAMVRSGFSHTPAEISKLLNLSVNDIYSGRLAEM